MVALGCVSNSTNSCTTIAHQYFQVHPKFPKYLHCILLTENSMLTWGKIGVVCYFWMMALYLPSEHTRMVICHLDWMVLWALSLCIVGETTSISWGIQCTCAICWPNITIFTDLCDTHYITCIYVSTQNGHIYTCISV